MPVDPYTQNKMRDDYSWNAPTYPSPFFDLSKNYIPSNIKTLFKYCHAFFHTDPFLSNVVRKITEYPLTDILYDEDTPTKVREKYDKILHENLQITTKLIEVGLDYNTYGNCFISRFLKFKRYLVDPDTQKRYPTNSKDISWTYKKYKFYATIDGMEKEMDVEDEPINTIEAFKLVRWNPENIEIKYHPISGEKKYYYQIPNNLRKQIMMGDKFIIENTPLIFLEAVKQKKQVEFDNKNFYHFKKPGLSESDMGWGKPAILSAIRQIYYLQILKKGNEAIANEHIVPKKAISPANTATLDPLTQMNLPKWKGEMVSTIQKWRRDPNYIAVFPIPIAYQELGGNARGLMTTPEMKFIEETVINSQGVPIEFIKGGASWTGSSISLRIVENMFLTYRNQLMEFLNFFVIPAIQHHLKYPKVKLKFKKFKMTDDNSSKQLLLQLSEMGKLSDHKLLDAFGYDYEEVAKELNESIEGMRTQQIKTQEATAKAEGKGRIILEKANIRAQLEAQREHLRVRMEHLQNEIEQERGAIPENFLDLIESIALQIMYMPPEQQISHMDKLSKTNPTTYALVMEAVDMYRNSGIVRGAEVSKGQSGNPNSKEDPPNQKSPGERESNKVKPRKKEKTKANTRGEPQP